MYGLTAVATGGFSIALAVGMMTGMLGIGGGFLLIPGLIILLGTPGPTAVGTGMATILVTTSFAILNRRRTDTVDVRLAMTVSAGGVLGVAIGLYFLEALTNSAPILINGRRLDAVQYILMCSFAVFLLSLAGFLSFDHLRTRGTSSRKRVGLLAAVRVPPYAYYQSLEQPRLSVIALALLGLGAGVLTGLTGVGGGIILLPALIYLVGQSVAKAAGTSLIIVWISSLVSVVLNTKHGNVDLGLWAAMTAGGATGAFIGTRLGLKADDAKLRVYFLCVVLGALVLVCYKMVDLTFG